MKLALFRVDASHHLGLGHVMRCLAFARGLEKTGVKSVFAMKDYEPGLTNLVQRFGYKVFTLPQAADFVEDARLTSNFISHHQAGLIITDLTHNDNKSQQEGYAHYLQLLKAPSAFLVIIDPIRTDLPADILVMPYYGANNTGYKSNYQTRLLLGPTYFIFREEFIEAAKVTREIKQDAQNLLVTMGGSDPLQITQKVSRAITGLVTRSPNLQIVIGPSFTGLVKPEIEEIFKNYHGDYKIVIGGDNMAHLMLWADLVITGGGLTKYEAAVTGTPNITISHHAEEAKHTDEFARGGSTRHLGIISQITEEKIASAIETLLTDQTLRAKMSASGRRIVDGSGVERIISKIPGRVLYEE